MSFLDKLKGMLGADSVDDEYEEGEIVNKTETKKTPGDKVLKINANASLCVVVVKPVHFQDSSVVVDYLKDNKTVVLNLESTNREASRRIMDFSSGAAYAVNGQIKCIAHRTFIITPYNVDIVGEDIIDELESNGVFFK